MFTFSKSFTLSLSVWHLKRLIPCRDCWLQYWSVYFQYLPPYIRHRRHPVGHPYLYPRPVNSWKDQPHLCPLPQGPSASLYTFSRTQSCVSCSTSQLHSLQVQACGAIHSFQPSSSPLRASPTSQLSFSYRSLVLSDTDPWWSRCSPGRSELVLWTSLGRPVSHLHSLALP